MSETTLFGMKVVVDPKIPDDEMRAVSLTYDPLTNEMRVLDQVRLINIKPPTSPIA